MPSLRKLDLTVLSHPVINFLLGVLASLVASWIWTYVAPSSDGYLEIATPVYPASSSQPIVVELIQARAPSKLTNPVRSDFGWAFTQPDVNVRATVVQEETSNGLAWKLETLLIYRIRRGESVHLLGKVNGGPPSGIEVLRDETLGCSYRASWSIGDRAVPARLKTESAEGKPEWLNYYLILDIQPLEERAVCQL